jgi:uncharacterized protein YfdQ (DUF2303 family)
MSDYETPRKAEAEVVAALVQNMDTVQPLNIEAKGDRNALLLAVPSGRHIISAQEFIEETEGAPWRSKGTVRVSDVAALVAMVNRHKTEHTVIYVDHERDVPSIVAVLNDDANDAPGFGDWRVLYSVKFSPEWGTWTTLDGHSFDMSHFSSFLEDNILDILDPKTAPPSATKILDALSVKAADAAMLQGISREFSVNVNSKVKEARSLQSGEAQIMFGEEHTDAKGKPVKVPGAFIIKVPVFEGGDHFAVVARLRYRVRGGAITWTYKLFRTDLVLRTVVAELVQKVEKETGCLTVLGRPK